MKNDVAFSGVIWDVDDVLVDTAGMFQISRERTLSFLGIKPDEMEHAIDVWNRLFWYFELSDRAGILTALVHELGKDKIISSEQVDSAIAIYRDTWANEIGAVTGIVDVVSELRNRSIPQAIVTNGELDWQMHKLTNAGLAHFFDPKHIFVAESRTPQAKPNPYGILQTCKTLEIQPTKAVYVGDRAVDTIAANIAGVVSILFSKTPKAPEVHWAPEEGTIGLENPKYTVDSVTQLSKLLLG